MGADAYLELDTWCRWRALLGQVSLIVMSRPGSLADLGDKAAGDWEHLATFARDHLDGRYRLQADPWRLEHPLWSSIHFTRVPAWDLSSRQIRRRLKAGRSVEGLVPEPVAAYIASKGLYQ
jgi:nicotinate-nucleotide adenylyltransferase